MKSDHVVLIVCMGLLIIGTIGLNVLPSTVSKNTFRTTTTDGVEISYILYHPQNAS